MNFGTGALSRESEWGTVTSFLPDAGRLTVKAESRDDFFLRPPHWAPKESVRAFIGTNGVPVEWSGAYARFAANPGDELTITYPLVGFTHTVSGLWPVTAPDLEMTFHWLGNTVTDSSPTGGRTPLFGDKPRVLPPAPHTGGTH